MKIYVAKLLVNSFVDEYGDNKNELSFTFYEQPEEYDNKNTCFITKPKEGIRGFKIFYKHINITKHFENKYVATQAFASNLSELEIKEVKTDMAKKLLKYIKDEEKVIRKEYALKEKAIKSYMEEIY